MKQKLYFSVGGNIDPHIHIVAAMEGLSSNFEGIETSSVYESHSIGFCGGNFLNLVVGCRSTKTVRHVLQILKGIEDSRGRNRSAAKFSSRTLDIDILTVGNLTGKVEQIELPRYEILENAFVLLPLAELAPDDVHPVSGKTYLKHWQEFDKLKHRLWPADFYWRGRNITTIRNDASLLVGLA